MGATVAEVREISFKEYPPKGADWLLIERAGDKFTVNGSATGKREATFFVPRAFDTIDSAISPAKGWAELNDVPVVYIRDLSTARSP